MSELKKSIFKYLDLNPIDDSRINKYEPLRKAFNLSGKQASEYWVDYKQKNTVRVSPENTNSIINDIKDNLGKNVKDYTQDTLSVNIDTEVEVKTLEDLLYVCDVDINKWDVTAWQCKKWDLGIKNQDNKIETKQLYSVSAKFKRKSANTDLGLQKEIILKELFEKSPKVRQNPLVFKKNAKGGLLLELALFDVHFGKLAHEEESGEDYDLQIASARYLDAVAELLSRVNLNNVSRILLPIGQDMINVDNLMSTTTAGTPQDCDSRFHKIVRTVKTVLIDVINSLKQLALVDVVCVPGNHDEQTAFMMAEILGAYYHNDDNVNVFNTSAPRKYYQFGVNGFMLTHGNKEKMNELGMIFAAENPELWCNTKYRFIQIGHFHHNKKITTLQTQEFQGFTVSVLPSISSSDAWHAGKGYMALKQAKAFLYDAEDGLIGEFNYNVKK